MLKNMKDMIIKNLKDRYSVKIFNKELKIKDEDWEVMEEALLLTPSSFGLEPWKFLVITNQELKEKLKPASWGQSQISDCSHLVVFCSRKHLDEGYINASIQRIADVRGVEISSLNLYKERITEYAKHLQNHLEYTTNQTFIALGNILTVASILNIQACPIGGFEPQKYNEILNIDKNYTASVVCAFGYKSNEDKYAITKKVRKKKEDIITKYI